MAQDRRGKHKAARRDRQGRRRRSDERTGKPGVDRGQMGDARGRANITESDKTIEQLDAGAVDQNDQEWKQLQKQRERILEILGTRLEPGDPAKEAKTAYGPIIKVHSRRSRSPRARAANKRRFEEYPRSRNAGRDKRHSVLAEQEDVEERRIPVHERLGSRQQSARLVHRGPGTSDVRDRLGKRQSTTNVTSPVRKKMYADTYLQAASGNDVRGELKVTVVSELLTSKQEELTAHKKPKKEKKHKHRHTKRVEDSSKKMVTNEGTQTVPCEEAPPADDVQVVSTTTGQGSDTEEKPTGQLVQRDNRVQGSSSRASVRKDEEGRRPGEKREGSVGSPPEKRTRKLDESNKRSSRHDGRNSPDRKRHHNGSRGSVSRSSSESPGAQKHEIRKTGVDLDKKKISNRERSPEKESKYRGRRHASRDRYHVAQARNAREKKKNTRLARDSSSSRSSTRSPHKRVMEMRRKSASESPPHGHSSSSRRQRKSRADHGEVKERKRSSRMRSTSSRGRRNRSVEAKHERKRSRRSPSATSSISSSEDGRLKVKSREHRSESRERKERRPRTHRHRSVSHSRGSTSSAERRKSQTKRRKMRATRSSSPEEVAYSKPSRHREVSPEPTKRYRRRKSSHGESGGDRSESGSRERRRSHEHRSRHHREISPVTVVAKHKHLRDPAHATSSRRRRETSTSSDVASD